MAVRFYNTLAGKVEDFVPLADNEVRFYTCGPTVYDFAHIGNYRTFVFQDVLRRHLKYRGYQVRQVMNLTDVDDKTIRNSQAAGMELRDYTAKYIEAFEVDRELLNLEKPELMVRATDHIDDMVKTIQTLAEKGYAYSSEGSEYFSVKQFKDYGKLSKIDFAGMRDGARVDSDEYEKESARDFVLWKAAKEGEPRWETPLGPGRPGWHIECSVMSMKYLGETFDIHSGGSDLVFPHHENEIAQSEAATGKPFVRYWLHAEHLMVDGKKMSKSEGNFFTLRDLIAKGYKPSAIRYLLASSHFRMPLNFTFEGLHQAQQSIQRLRNFRGRLTTEKFPAGEGELFRTRAQAARQAFEDALDDNLNTAAALAAVFDLVREGNTAMDRGEFPEDARAGFLDVLERWDRIFAVLDDTDYEKLKRFGFIKNAAVTPTGEPLISSVGTPTVEPGNGDQSAVLSAGVEEKEIEKRIADREAARQRGEYAAADEIRGELLKAGVILEDTKAGTRWKRK
ncbi:MAG TPA: cysteine--tRNA ligase [Terriglobia bacterium]|nr:cysteine--tRNA ligase [Terriglobia bacterium]